MISNGKNGPGQWPTTIELDNPYVTRTENGTGEDHADKQARPATADVTDLPPLDTGRKRKRRGRLLFLCVVALLVICAGLAWYTIYGGRSRVDYQIAEKKGLRPAQITEQPRAGTGGENETANPMTSDAINQAKEELRKTGPSADGTTGASGSTGATAAIHEVTDAPAAGNRQASSGPIFTPYIVPDTPIITGTRGIAATGRGAGQAGNEPAGGIERSGGVVAGSNAGQSYRNGTAATAYSIYAVTPERRVVNVPSASRSPRLESRSAAPALAPNGFKLPPFGAMLPVRTLGAFYTLRNASLARFELTRDLSGDGWSLKRGTVLIAQNQGSENDRAFLSLMGFIDPDTNRFIRLVGEVLGGDGGPGLKGKKRKFGGALMPVLNRVANGALTLGQAALSRGGTTIVVPGGSLTGYGNDLGLSRSALSQREFVEVAAGAPAYVMVTDLPKEVRGVDADPTIENEGDTLTDEELADLLSNGTPEQIKEALPRMPPEMRKVANLVVGGR